MSRAKILHFGSKNTELTPNLDIDEMIKTYPQHE